VLIGFCLLDVHYFHIEMKRFASQRVIEVKHNRLFLNLHHLSVNNLPIGVLALKLCTDFQSILLS
jgi:coproporphyrinogen III oxidase-like Fe-S oxidoreductase